MGASVDTLRRRRQELQIPDDYPYSTITDAELDEIVREIKRAHFKARARVRESLHRVDPEGVIQRWQPLIPEDNIMFQVPMRFGIWMAIISLFTAYHIFGV